LCIDKALKGPKQLVAMHFHAPKEQSLYEIAREVYIFSGVFKDAVIKADCIRTVGFII